MHLPLACFFSFMRHPESSLEFQKGRFLLTLGSGLREPTKDSSTYTVLSQSKLIITALLMWCLGSAMESGIEQVHLVNARVHKATSNITRKQQHTPFKATTQPRPEDPLGFQAGVDRDLTGIHGDSKQDMELASRRYPFPHKREIPQRMQLQHQVQK